MRRSTPWIAAVEQFIGNNTSIFRRHPEQFEDAAIIGLERQSLAAFGQLRPLLIERGRQGLIRRGHGDLHLGNIAVLDGEPVAFDALEFDPIMTGPVTWSRVDAAGSPAQTCAKARAAIA